jgi:hypothetical protein
MVRRAAVRQPQAMATMASTMIGTFRGEGPCPGRTSVSSGVAPEFDDEVAEAVDDVGVLCEA